MSNERTKIAVTLDLGLGMNRPYEIEWIWVHACGSQYTVDSVPLYARDVNYGDVVEAQRRGGDERLELRRVVKRSQYKLFHLRVVNATAEELRAIIDLLIKLSCLVEIDEQTGTVGVAIPPDVDGELVRRIFVEARRDGLIDFEDCSE